MKKQFHGQSKAPLYKTWRGMLTRCRNEKAESYKYYGGRGITVCERWLSFSAFLLDMGERPLGHTLDRIDVNGNYEPSNCRWATREQQCRNMRSTVYVEYNGQTMVLKDAATLANLPSGVASNRLKRGTPLDKPMNRRFRMLSDAEHETLRKMISEGAPCLEIKAAMGVSAPTISRIKKKMGLSKSAT